MIGLDPLDRAVFDGLSNAYRNHVALGEAGKAKDKANRFGDMAMRADIEAEEHILTTLREFADKNNICIICKSEELGENKLNSDGKETFFAVFDGLDGSSNYLNKNQFGYGTMIAIAKGDSPTYEDFIIAGEAMMEEGKIVLARKRKGVFIYDVYRDEFEELPKFEEGESFDDARTLANKYFDEEIKAYGDKSWVYTRSTAWSIFSICTDSKFNGLIEVTRKGNLEQPILYLMISELGGVMVDTEGKPIGDRDFRNWAQSRDGEEYFITAKNMEIAQQVLTLIDI